jgi:hypothetical protein
VEQRADHDAEADQQPDLGHQLAEAQGDRLERAGEADAARQAEVERAQHQRDDGVDPAPDDQADHQSDRDGCVQNDHWFPHSRRLRSP